jgi:para-nitrobenzyl esterase
MAYGSMFRSLVRPALAATEPGPVVETAAGKIRGVSAKGVSIFRGVPYGAPTEGAGRFRPPQKPKPWTGVRDALRDGPICLQVSGLPNEVAFDKIEGRSDRSFMSENCLTLNVWSPAQNGAKLPVMVWFHGGGFHSGSALEIRSDGRNLASNGDVVVVGVNHRLGPFGYLYLDHLARKYTGSGNTGIFDLVLALEWVRDNITNFGGNPDNVTVFGQSGGGAKVRALLTMPAARGLAHKAIIQSGAYARTIDPEEAIQGTGIFLNELGISPNDIDKLQLLPAFRLIDAYQAIVDRNGGISGALGGPTIGDLERFLQRKIPQFAPVVDGTALPVRPFDAAASGATADVPIVIGTNRDEVQIQLVVSTDLFKIGSEEELKAKLDAVAGDKGEALARLYRRKHPTASLEDAFVAAVTEIRHRRSTVQFAETKIAHWKAPLYMYRMDFQSPSIFRGRKLRASHDMELTLVFDTVDLFPGPTGGGPAARATARNMSRSWAAFAHTGRPDAAGLPHWPPYSVESRATMIFDSECTIVSDPDAEERLLATS